MSISQEQREQIEALLSEDIYSREQIAERVGVSPGTVSALKAHRTIRLAQTNESDENEVICATEATFGLERDMQAALRENIEQLEAGLRIVDGGHEQTTKAGRIDITAEDNSGSLVIIELKAGNASPDSVAQVLSYMGAVADKEPRNMRGILVAGDFPDRVIYAARAVPNLSLRRYSFRFQFEPAE